MSETRETMIRRLRMRSMRRGIKEMDLILQAFAEATLHDMSETELMRYDSLLEESDHDLYAWVAGTKPPPSGFAPLIARIAETRAFRG